jgi:hypothetical protein
MLRHDTDCGDFRYRVLISQPESTVIRSIHDFK